MSLFPIAQRQQYPVQFNAGKCTREGNILKPDLRKGMVYMEQDLIIFPDEAELVRVPECTTGRVYLLRFKTSHQKFFFWMQSKNDGKDEENVRRVNQLINDPLSAMDDHHTSSGGDAMMDYDNQNNMNRVPQQLFQLLQTAGGPGGSVPTTTPAGGDGPVDRPADIAGADLHEVSTPSGEGQQNNQPGAGSINPEQLNQLGNILSEVRTSEEDRPAIQLSDVLSPEALAPLLNDPEICSSLFPFLPENAQHTPQEVRQVVQNPQFQQALHSLTAALQSGQLGPLLSQLGLDPAAGTDVESFLRAIEEQARRREHERHNDDMDEDA
ncbi:adhesion regulating molecule 1 [Apophysomyces ossiformis]|uniref:Adhesion regulating molecule 1 n=1 Tax=Apophysomyces ossiformis TaxID=679940 RepID=A0A8H7BQS8_9FUNG|nr:adhesion regulating molecule 1 [Apophysomyces ossiformis]